MKIWLFIKQLLSSIFYVIFVFNTTLITGMNFKKETPLQESCKSEDLNSFEEMINSGAHVLELGRYKNSLLHIVKDDEKAQLLLKTELSQHLNDENSSGNTALHNAAKLPNTKIASLFVKAGANPHLFNNRKQNALHVATNCNNIAMVDLLLSSTQIYDNVDSDGMTSLMTASQLGYEEIVRLLIEARRTNLHATNQYGHNSLHFAKKDSIIHMLCGAGLNVLSPGNYGHTPIRLACLGGVNAQGLQSFIDHGANPHEIDSDGNNLLHCVQSESVAKILIDNKVDANLKNSKGQTPLHRAAQFNKPELALYLISIGVDIHSTNQEGQTPLHFAYTTQTVKALLDAGADIDSVDSRLSTPIQSILRIQGRMLWGDLAELFFKRGTDVYHKDDKDFDTIAIALLYSVDSAMVLSAIVPPKLNWNRYYCCCLDSKGVLIVNKENVLKFANKRLRTSQRRPDEV